jgi:hypothetical protein
MRGLLRKWRSLIWEALLTGKLIVRNDLYWEVWFLFERYFFDNIYVYGRSMLSLHLVIECISLLHP